MLDDAHATFADHLVELVTTESVDAIPVAEDVYDRAIPPNDAVALPGETLHRLTGHARVVPTPGGHDSAHRLGFAADLMREGLVIRARTAGLDHGIVLPDADGDEATIIHTLPYLDPDAAREILPPLFTGRLGEETLTKHTAEEDQTEGEGAISQPAQPKHPRLSHSHEVAVSTALRLVAADLDRLRTGRTRRLPSLPVARAFIVGGETCESERGTRAGGVDSVPSDVFAILGGSPLVEHSSDLDYVALGHLHRPQKLTRPADSRLVYSGSPLPFSFNEAEGARSAATRSSVLLDLDADGVTGLERIPTLVLHQIRTLTGTTPEFLSPAFDNAIGTWVRTILQSERSPGALATLKRRFLSLLAFQHEAPTRTARKCIAVTAAVDLLRIIGDLFDDVCGRTPQPSKRNVLRNAYKSALASAGSER